MRAFLRAATRTAARAAALGAIAALGATAACSSGPYRPQTLFTLDGGATSAEAAGAKPHAGTLRVRSVSVAAPYSSSEFAYRYTDGRMRTDSYGGLIAPPEQLFTAALVDRLGRERTFEAVVGPTLTQLQAYELAVSVTQFGAVFEGAGTACMKGSVFLIDPTAQPNLLVTSFQVQASAPIAGQSVEAVAEALNAALAEWLGQLSAQIRAAAIPPLTAASSPSRATK